jgi:hypothetical protein
MLESSFRNLVAGRPFPDQRVAQLRRFTTSLIEQGYADETVRLKLQLLRNVGQWLGRNDLAVTNLDERVVEAFLNLSSSKNLSAHRRGSVRRASGLVLVGYTEVNFLRV